MHTLYSPFYNKHLDAHRPTRTHTRKGLLTKEIYLVSVVAKEMLVWSLTSHGFLDQKLMDVIRYTAIKKLHGRDLATTMVQLLPKISRPVRPRRRLAREKCAILSGWASEFPSATFTPIIEVSVHGLLSLPVLFLFINKQYIDVRKLYLLNAYTAVN